MFPFDFEGLSGLDASSCEATLRLLNIGRELPKMRIHTHCREKGNKFGFAPPADLAPHHYAAYSLAPSGMIFHCTPLPCVASHIKILIEL